MRNVSRREFLQVSSSAAVTAGLAMSPAAAESREKRKASPNEKVVVGFIGVAGRGTALMRDFSQYDDMVIGAVCDAYKPHLEAAVGHTKSKAKAYRDFRKLLEHKGLDAVVIATPPHWHPLTFIYACQAGLDVYCEKPMCLYPLEGRAMVNAARRYNRVTQIGTQIHAGDNYRRVVEIVRSGILGQILSLIHISEPTRPY